MPVDCHSTAAPSAALFVHLRLETAGAAPWLADEDVAQAARTALAARARLYRCRVLAVGSGDDHLHTILRFPASMPLNQLIHQMQQVSGRAAAHLLTIRAGQDAMPNSLWSGRYQLDTLSECDVAGLIAYVGQHPDIHARGEARPERERTNEGSDLGHLPAGQRPAWSYFVRERTQRYLFDESA